MISGGSKKRSIKMVSGSKKLVIKPLKRQPSLPDAFEATTWDKLEAAVHAVHNATAVEYSRNELYAGVESMCSHKMGASLYTKLEAVRVAHVARLVGSLAGQTLDDAAYLALMETVWNQHCQQTVIIRSIFLVLDRTYALQTPGLRSLWDMGMHLFKSELLAHDDILHKLVSALLHTVERERDGETVDRPQLAALTRMFTSLSLYDQFAAAFLETTTSYYQAEGLRYMATADVAKYVSHINARYKEESLRAVAYLNPDTQRPLMTVLDEQLVSAHVVALLEKGFQQLCKENRTDTLSLMYSLFARVNRTADMRQHFLAYASTNALAIVNDTEKDKEMVDRLLALKDALDAMVAACFRGDDAFVAAVKETLERAVNTRGSRPAELIAKFMDSKLRTGNKGSSEAELEADLTRAMVLFRAVHGKDTFEAFYKKDLAKRLLLGRSASVDLEKSVLSKLKTECGSGFTAKLEGMFKDVDLSKEFMAAFTAARREAGTAAAATSPPSPDMFVHTLTTTYWPTYPPMELTLPPVLAAPQAQFNKFYDAKYRGKRVLTWQHSLGHCLLRAHFPAGRKELSVSLFQTLVLLLFNDADAWSLADIATATGIENGELRRTLQSLACGRVRPIVKRPKSKDVKDGDTFHFNASFKAKLLRLKINTIQLKETKEEVAATHERVAQDRQYQVDAAIVRTMKTRKTLTHQLLVSELWSQLKFPATVSDLKKRIASLIDREYIERDADNPMTYHYVA